MKSRVIFGRVLQGAKVRVAQKGRGGFVGVIKQRRGHRIRSVGNNETANRFGKARLIRSERSR